MREHRRRHEAAGNGFGYDFALKLSDAAQTERINAINTRTKVLDRMKLIERLEFDSVVLQIRFK